jgi:hypothetical protein
MVPLNLNISWQFCIWIWNQQKASIYCIIKILKDKDRPQRMWLSAQLVCTVPGEQGRQVILGRSWPAWSLSTWMWPAGQARQPRPSAKEFVVRKSSPVKTADFAYLSILVQLLQSKVYKSSFSFVRSPELSTADHGTNSVIWRQLSRTDLFYLGPALALVAFQTHPTASEVPSLSLDSSLPESSPCSHTGYFRPLLRCPVSH